jgi:hypothetical protein
VFVVLAFIAVQVLFLALLFLVFALLSRQRVEVTNWDDLMSEANNPNNPVYQIYPDYDHPVYPNNFYTED